MTSRHLIAVFSTAVLVSLAGSPALAEEAPQPSYPIQIEAAHGPGGVHYLINVRNNTETPASLVVVQRFAAVPANLTASGEGQVENSSATWTLEIAPKDLNRVSSEAAFGRGVNALTTVCLTTLDPQQVVDCAAGDLAPAAKAAQQRGPVWTVAAIGFVLAGMGLMYFAYTALRKRASWWAAAVRWAVPRRNMLAVVGSMVALLALAAGGFLVLAVKAKPFLDAQAGTNKANIGWAGEPRSLELGVPVTSRQAEFTVYQWSCASHEDGSHTCVATVAARNTTETPVPWISRMQRLSQGKDEWILPDIEATNAANGGNDPFDAPLAAKERRFASIVYRPSNPAGLTRLELREGAFSAGVSLNLK